MVAVSCWLSVSRVHDKAGAAEEDPLIGRRSETSCAGVCNLIQVEA